MENNQDNSVLAHIKSLTEKEEHLYTKEDLSDEDVKDLHHANPNWINTGTCCTGVVLSVMPAMIPTMRNCGLRIPLKITRNKTIKGGQRIIGLPKYIAIPLVK
jgi:hypothetical protein